MVTMTEAWKKRRAQNLEKFLRNLEVNNGDSV